MNSVKNKVQLIGRLGKDAEIIQFDSGATKASFQLAVNESYKDKNGEWQDKVSWHSCVAWSKTAELVSKLLKKGDEIVLEGRLDNSSYETKEGEKRYATNIEVKEFYVLPRTNKVESES